MVGTRRTCPRGPEAQLPHIPPEGWGCTCVPPGPCTQSSRAAVGLLWGCLGCFCSACARACCQPSAGRPPLPSLGVTGASQAVGVPVVLGAHGGPAAGGQGGLLPSFGAVFDEAGRAQAPCAAVRGACGRMVACVALDRDVPLGKPCPHAPGQSPALACHRGGRAGHWAVSHRVLSTLGWVRGAVLLLGRGEHQGGCSQHLSRAI